MLVRTNQLTSCQIYQLNRDASAKRGKYLDLKLKPEQAHELPEAKEWPALGAFIEAINRLTLFQTTGCTASGPTAGGHDAPFVDIAFIDPRMSVSRTACRHLASRLLALSDPSTLGNFVLDLWDASATLPKGETITSLRCWLIGSRSDAEAAFPLILAKLGEQDAADYAKMAEADYAKHLQERADEARGNRRLIVALAVFLLVWLAVGFTGAWLLSGYGWMGIVGGFVGGMLVFLAVVLSIVIVIWRVLADLWRKASSQQSLSDEKR